MITVILDTNVFISAALFPTSTPARIIKLVRKEKIRIAASQSMIEEVVRVMSYARIGASREEIEQTVGIFDSAIITPGRLRVAQIKEDPSDNMFLVCAVESEADFIVSGDKHLKDLGSFQGIPIVTPAEFLRIDPGI